MPFLNEGSAQKLTNLIRLENEAELFHLGNTRERSLIETNPGKCDMGFTAKEGLTIRLNDYPELKVDSELMISDKRGGPTWRELTDY